MAGLAQASGHAPSVVIVHAIAGRVRVRIPALRGAVRAMAELESTLGAEPLVSEAVASARTGSLLVRCAPGDSGELLALLARVVPGLDTAELARRLRGELLDEREPGPRAALLSALNERLAAASGDLALWIPGGLLAMSGVRLIRAPRVAPSWYELLWFSFNSFVVLNELRRRGSPPGPSRRPA